MYVCVCVCVRERDGEGQKQKDKRATFKVMWKGSASKY